MLQLRWSTFCLRHWRRRRPIRRPTPPLFARDPQLLLDGYRHVEVASVSDAIKARYGERRYMSHRMHELFTAKFAGFAVTVKLVQDEKKTPDDGGPARRS
jgi:hypothetical protein